jgi:hypothetical protein
MPVGQMHCYRPLITLNILLHAVGEVLAEGKPSP